MNTHLRAGLLIVLGAMACGGEGLDRPAQDLSGTSWQWVSVSSSSDSLLVQDPGKYTVTFGQDGSLDLLADCNKAGGDYLADGAAAFTLSASSVLAQAGQYLKVIIPYAVIYGS